MQDVRERCYDLRGFTIAIVGYIELFKDGVANKAECLERALDAAKKADQMALQTQLDATEAAKGTPDYRPEPYKL